MGRLWGRPPESHIKLTSRGGSRRLWPNICLSHINITIHKHLCLVLGINSVCALTFDRSFFLTNASMEEGSAVFKFHVWPMPTRGKYPIDHPQSAVISLQIEKLKLKKKKYSNTLQMLSYSLVAKPVPIPLHSLAMQSENTSHFQNLMRTIFWHIYSILKIRLYSINWTIMWKNCQVIGKGKLCFHVMLYMTVHPSLNQLWDQILLQLLIFVTILVGRYIMLRGLSYQLSTTNNKEWQVVIQCSFLYGLV